MNRNLRQSMSGLHSWTGLLPGWLLFIIFLFGTAAFFQSEITGWMKPELRSAGVTDETLGKAHVYLNEKAPHAARWSISLPGGRRPEPLTLSWSPREGSSGQAGEAVLDAQSGREIAVRDTQGGYFLYRFHYDLHYLPQEWTRLAICVAALAALVALVSGIITHKKIFADFFLMRFGKGQRSWLDVHNVTAVLALPFHLMIIYTGLVTLLFTMMPWAISAHYPSVASFYEEMHAAGPTREATGEQAPLLPIADLADRASRVWHGAEPSYIAIENPGDAAAMVTIWPRNDAIAGSPGAIYLNGVTGRLLHLGQPKGPAAATQDVMIDIHAGRFSSPVLRWLYFLSGIGGTVMIASGLVLWTVKRRSKLPDPGRPHFGFRLVERLNIGVIAGAPAGIAVYFIANRLLPPDMANRADWEINSLFIAWGAMFVWTLARPAQRAWVEALAACAALYALVPIVSALTTTRGLIPSLIARDWIFAGFDGTMLATAAACGLAAWKVAGHKPKTASRHKPRARAEAAA